MTLGASVGTTSFGATPLKAPSSASSDRENIIFESNPLPSNTSTHTAFTLSGAKALHFAGSRAGRCGAVDVVMCG